MQKLEQREILVTYCDVCGSECEGSFTTLFAGTPNEKHACHGWIEEEETRCDLKLVAMNNARKPTPSPA